MSFTGVGSLLECNSREDVRAAVDEAYPQAKPGTRANFAGQLWALRHGIKPGDLIVMPLKSDGQIAIGTCTAGYAYDAGEPDRSRRHYIAVTWTPERMSRSVFKDDLLNTINGAMTVFKATRNNAEFRLRAVQDQGSDPGLLGVPARPVPSPAERAEERELDESGLLDPAPAPTIEAIRDTIRTRIVENFSGHKLTGLVADILTALGYICTVSPAGPDGGVDILAGSGPLGLDSPTLVVEVKSEPTPVKTQVARGLQGAVSSNQADQGLLVAWGGINSAAKREFSQQRTRMAFWDADDVLDKLFEVYPQLPDVTKAALPLKLVWVLDGEPAAV
ncbi:restriction endonuclease [Arthrobacter nitrophenolicus]|uniref:Restriction system protein n=2 Tax=Arthrobacter nitrophenolicus TaxID=683150 RepID=A0ACC6TK95_9MICC|nr:restriction endonuclease [Arthrobacter nitrophenolicus]ELT44191.1 hypothetical protein G205_13357 [Arthrobacter nitrophenolicus]